MTITSTEFQQRVGYYLELAEKGEDVNVTRLKPTKATFKIIKQKEKPQQVLNEGERILKELKKFKFKSTGETGLELQRRVRS